MTREKSPATTANKRFPAPAAVTCHPVALNTSIPDCHRFDSTDPNAHKNDPPKSESEAQNSRLPSVEVECNSGQNSTSSPIIPRASPALPRQVMRWCPSNNESSTRNHNGVIAIINAANPDGTESSAHESVRFPPISSRSPTTAASAICRAEYQILRPVAAHTASITTPAIENRTPHISAGGIVCTAISIAR